MNLCYNQDRSNLFFSNFVITNIIKKNDRLLVSVKNSDVPLIFQKDQSFINAGGFGQIIKYSTNYNGKTYFFVLKEFKEDSLQIHSKNIENVLDEENKTIKYLKNKNCSVVKSYIQKRTKNNPDYFYVMDYLNPLKNFNMLFLNNYKNISNSHISVCNLLLKVLLSYLNCTHRNGYDYVDLKIDNLLYICSNHGFHLIIGDIGGFVKKNESASGKSSLRLMVPNSGYINTLCQFVGIIFHYASICYLIDSNQINLYNHYYDYNTFEKYTQYFPDLHFSTKYMWSVFPFFCNNSVEMYNNIIKIKEHYYYEHYINKKNLEIILNSIRDSDDKEIRTELNFLKQFS